MHFVTASNANATAEDQHICTHWSTGTRQWLDATLKEEAPSLGYVQLSTLQRKNWNVGLQSYRAF